jgi:flavin reductase (DIM6/NTAB) family NADH-FMN oxidoreductase RutF
MITSRDHRKHPYSLREPFAQSTLGYREQMADQAFTTITTSLDVPLIVVTASDGSERAGCLVGFHVQSSIEPARFCVWLSKANHTYRIALRATHLGIHFLTTAQVPLAEHFGTITGDDRDKFTDVDVHTGMGEVPVLEACANRLIVRRTVLVDEGGDHVCMAAEVVSAHSTGAFVPLRLSQASHLKPGHGSEERHTPPTERADD